MKAALIGIGQAGGRISEVIQRVDRQAGYDAIQGVLAVNTATADLEGLDVETMLIGQDRVDGHGVGADNELGASIMQSDVGDVMAGLDGIVGPSTEAIFVVAGLGGGTGSGGAPVLARELNRVYEIPVYGLAILPGRQEAAIYQANAGRSLKTFVREADSVLLVDNDSLRNSEGSVSDSFQAANEMIARRLGLVLAAGENVEGVGESVVDSSEIINTLRSGGMAALGYASADAGEDPAENINVVMSATRRALLSEMSIPEATDADAGLVIVAGPKDRIPRKGVERARQWVEERIDSMEVRGGDLPLETERIGVIIVLSGIIGAERIESFLARAREANETVDREDPASAFDSEELDGLF